MRALPALIFLVAIAGCSSSTPSTPSPVPPNPIQPANFSGTITATNGGSPVAGVTLSSGATTATSDGAGAFSLASGGSVSLTGGTILPRIIFFAAPGHGGIALSVFRQDGTFDLAFYRQFARDGFERPAALQPIRRLLQAPRIYLKTVDEAGQTIDAATLAMTESALLGVAGTWSGGQFGLAGIERGTDSREGMAGWLTVKWPNPSAGAFCGLSQIGTDGGWIQLNYLRQDASCAFGGSRIWARTVRHELGHAFGYYHTDNANDVMSTGLVVTDSDQLPSTREAAHARYVYSRPNGNSDPDNDPTSIAFSRPAGPPRVVVD